MERLIKIIQNYESDTFSASGEGVTEEEAKQVAERLLDRLCKVVEIGGTIVCDGAVLDELLYKARDHLVDCLVCRGSGGCKPCRGSGWSLDTDDDVLCDKCDGTGHCIACKGEGEVVVD